MEKTLEKKPLLSRVKGYEMLFAYVLMVVVFTILKPAYISAFNIRSILLQTSFLGIIASGMTMVVLTGGVDMSVGMMAGMATLSGIWPVVFDGAPLWQGLLLAFGLALLIGAINGASVAFLGVAPFVATLSTMFLAQGWQYLASDGGMAISYGFPDAYLAMGSGSVLGIPSPVLIYTALLLILLAITEFSPAGRYFRGTGLNQFASELSGVRIRWYTFLSYVICSVLATLFGLVLGASQSYVSPDHGSSFMIDSLLTVLLGKTLMNGRVSIHATAFGALFLRSFEAGLSMIGLPTTLLQVCKGVLLVAVLLFTGLRKIKGRGKV